MRPNLIMIGALKCGTTSLHNYLSLHPDIFMSAPKELNYFCDNWNRKSREWYESHFVTGKKIRGESSPLYTHGPRVEKVAERMFSVVPDAKLVYLLRDPIAKIAATYRHGQRWWYPRNFYPLTYEWLVKNHYLESSRYYAQLQKYLRYYAKDRILVVILEELSRNASEILPKIYRFLGVDETFQSARNFYHHNRSGSQGCPNRFGVALSRLPPHWNWVRHCVPGGMTHEGAPPQLTGRLRKRLCEELREDVAALRAWTGYALADWSL